jgi:hypothetical protein
VGQDADELKRDIERTRDDLGGTLDAIGDRVSPSRIMERRKNRMRNTVQTMRDRVIGPVHDGASAVSGSASHLTDSAGHAMGSAVDSVKHAPDQMRSGTQGAPMVAGALAFGVGFLAAAAFPASRREQQLGPALLEQVEPVKQQLADAGSEIAHHLQEPAMEAAADMRERVKEGAHEVSTAAGHEPATP